MIHVNLQRFLSNINLSQKVSESFIRLVYIVRFTSFTLINVEVGVIDLMLIISFQLRLWMNIPTVMQYIVPLRTVVIRFVSTDFRPKHQLQI